MDQQEKLIILNIIRENKDLLFGKFGDNITHDEKIRKWQEITKVLNKRQIFDRDWKYLRDTTWQNWKRRTLEKKERLEAGEKTAKFNGCDQIILNIIEKDASVDGLDVFENSENTTLPGTPLDIPAPIKTHFAKNKASILQQLTSMDEVCELVQLKKKKTEVEIELMKEKVEIARREKYKLDLELVKMERDLGIAQLSPFTAPYSPY